MRTYKDNILSALTSHFLIHQLYGPDAQRKSFLIVTFRIIKADKRSILQCVQAYKTALMIKTYNFFLKNLFFS